MSEKLRRSHAYYFEQFFPQNTDQNINSLLEAQGLNPDEVELPATEEDLANWVTLQALSARYNVRYAKATTPERRYIEKHDQTAFTGARRQEKKRYKQDKE